MNAYFTALSDTGCMTVTGRDARKFLQNYLTIDIDSVADRWRQAAICNIKGRAVATCQVVARPDGILLLLPKGLLEPVRTFLAQYIIFSKAEIKSAPATVIGLVDDNPDRLEKFIRATTGLEPPDAGRNHVGNSTCDLLFHKEGRYELILHNTPQRLLADIDLQPSLRWQEARVRAGIPWVEPESSSAFLPHQLNYHDTGGIDFDKGCYLGQEVIARMQYRGKQKRVCVAFESGYPCRATPMQQLTGEDGQTVGQVANAVSTADNCLILAVVRTDAATANLYLAAREGEDPVAVRPLKDEKPTNRKPPAPSTGSAGDNPA